MLAPLFLLPSAHAATQSAKLHFTNNTPYSVRVSLFSRMEWRWAVERHPLAPNQSAIFLVVPTFTYAIVVQLDGQQLPLGDFMPPRGSQNQVFPVALAMFFPAGRETAYRPAFAATNYQSVAQPVVQAHLSLQWFPVVQSPMTTVASDAWRQTAGWPILEGVASFLSGW